MVTMTTLLHDHTRTSLQALTEASSGSYIFHGPSGVGKATAAREIARIRNCLGDQPMLCTHCIQFDAGSYPDYIIVRPEGKPSILIEQIRTLIQALSLSSYYQDGSRIVVIDGADLMTIEAQNALLKVLEEPPADTSFVLIAERLTALLPTVRSRAAHIHFPRLPESQIAKLLVDRRGIPSPQAASLAAAADGAPGLAITLAANPTETATRLELARLAVSVPELSRFERLVLAGRLVATGADLPRFAGILQRHLTKGLREGVIEPVVASHSLQAIEQFRVHLQAKVAPRVALERLMVEI